eukprot:scaffold10129_cov69-Cyclotella_meneghiniana.AAC.4
MSTETNPEIKCEGDMKEPDPADTNQAKNSGSDEEEEVADKIPFPVLLHELVSDPDSDHCIHWLPGGKLFTISDKKVFAKEVLTKLNGFTKFTSFTRRLKRWGFVRVSSGPQIGSYQHPDFVKDEPERVKNIKYMHIKPYSLTAAQKKNAKLQAAAMDINDGAFGQVPIQGMTTLQSLFAQQQQQQQAGQLHGLPSANNNLLMPNSQQLSMLQSLLAQQQQQQQQMGMQLPGFGGSLSNNMAAANNNSLMQLNLLQEMQKQQNRQQHVAAAPASSGDSPKGNESYGEMLVRTNPALAAELIDTTLARTKNMTSHQGMFQNSAPSNPMPMQQWNMNPMENHGNTQNAMMFALAQQEQDVLRSLMNQGQMNQQAQQQQQQNNDMGESMNHGQQLNEQAHGNAFRRGSDVVTPSNSNS